MYATVPRVEPGLVRSGLVSAGPVPADVGCPPKVAAWLDSCRLAALLLGQAEIEDLDLLQPRAPSFT
jgi:hypothetical protein